MNDPETPGVIPMHPLAPDPRPRLAWRDRHAAILVAVSMFAHGQDWPSFRGPDGSGIARRGRIPASLDPGENLLWRAEIPPGYSSPIVMGNCVFLTAAEDEKLLTLCLDGSTGETRWRGEVPFDGTRVGNNSSASSTPTTDGEHVFSLFHHVGMIAYDLEGNETWRNDLGAPFNVPHGMSSSPLVHGDVVVIQIDQDAGSHLVALKKATGEVLWDVPRPGVMHGYATPVIHEPEEGPVQVITSGALQVVAYDLATGERLWWASGSAWQVKAMPVLHGDLCVVNAFMEPSAAGGLRLVARLPWERLLAMVDADEDGLVAKDEWKVPALQEAFFVFDWDGDEKLDAREYAYLQSAGTETGSLFTILLGGEGDVTETHVAWTYDDRKGMSDVVTPVIVDDTIFMVSDGGILTTLDVGTGEVGKQERIGSPDRTFASPVAAGGRVLMASLSGQVTVIEAERDWKVLSTVDLGEEIWSTPAIAAERVFIRSQEALYCFLAEER